MLTLDQIRVFQYDTAVAHAMREPTFSAASTKLPILPLKGTFSPLYTLAHIYTLFIMTSVNRAVLTNYRDLTDRRAAAMLLAIRLYEADHGAAPANLYLLVPAYLPAVPVDPDRGRGEHELRALASDRREGDRPRVAGEPQGLERRPSRSDHELAAARGGHRRHPAGVVDEPVHRLGAQLRGDRHVLDAVVGRSAGAASTGPADWTGEVIVPPALYPLKTVSVLAAGPGASVGGLALIDVPAFNIGPGPAAVAAAATQILCRLIIFPITPPLEFAAAINAGFNPR